MTKNLTGIIMPKELERVMEEYVKKQPECSAKNHSRYPQKILVPYRPNKEVWVRCQNCWKLYKRPPTPEEIQRYQDSLKT